MVDRLGKPELLFFGPDEGTADYMDWAALHAKARGYPVWKALTTGKGFSLGGEASTIQAATCMTAGTP